MLNIATLPGYFMTNPVSIRLISFAVVAALAVLYLIALNRLRKSAFWETRRYLLAVAAGTVLTLLPVYHRFCDIGVLLVETFRITGAMHCWLFYLLACFCRPCTHPEVKNSVRPSATAAQRFVLIVP
jgi:4-amino-4-deoxy-L-arabinose transferase-like glycosyltransferase